MTDFDRGRFLLALSQARLDLGPLPSEMPVFDASKHKRGAGGKFVQSGSSGAEVKGIQQAIGVKTDGTFGQQTVKAVRQFQKKNGLEVDGIVGQQTAAALLGGHKAKPGELTDEQRKKLREAVSYNGALVDKARLIKSELVLDDDDEVVRTEGTIRYTEPGDTPPGPWFRCRLELPKGTEAPEGGRRRKVTTPVLMTARKDKEANILVIKAKDQIEVESVQLGNDTWEVDGDPEPIRKKRRVIGWELWMKKVEREPGDSD